MAKIQRLNLAFEKANNLRIRSGQADNRILFDELAGEAAKIEGHLLKFISDCREVSRSSLLTEAGKSEKIAQLKGGIVEVLAKADKTAELDDKVARMQADLAGRAKAARDKNNAGDQVLAHLQQAEIRRYLVELRAQAKVEHEKSLERRSGLMLSDQERSFTDPVEKLFLEAVASYDGDKEMFIRGIESAPFPVAILPKDLVQQGLSALERIISPDFAAAVDIQVVKRAMTGIMLGEVAEIVNTPLTQAILQPQYIAQPDGGVA